MKKKYFVLAIFSILVISIWAKEPSSKAEYQLHHGENLPVIYINSNNKKNKFVKAPISYGVKKQMLKWGQTSSNPSPWYEDCKISITDENGASFMDSIPAQVKVRGNWTTTYNKKSLRIKFAKKQSMLDLNEGNAFKNWVLIAMYKDWSMLRDYTAQYLSKMISPYYSSDCRLVEVYINNKYWGVYLLAELQEVSKNRINITKAKKGYTGNDIGYLLEHDTYYLYENAEETFVLDYKLPITDIDGEKADENLLIKGFTIKNKINSKSQREFIKNYMTLLWELCYEAVYNNKYLTFNEDFTKLLPSDAKSSFDCVSKYVDIESLICMYILSEIYCDADLYWTSFYMDVDFGEKGNKKLTFEAPWDFDSALGNKNFCSDGKGLYAAKLGWDTDLNKYGTCNPWMILFVRCDWFQTLVGQKWQTIHENKVLEKALENIDFITRQYKDCFDRNQKKWKNAGQAWRFGSELSKESAACKNQSQAAAFLSTWLKRRFAGLDELWLESK
ncbi:MAG: CotH kinase family protein [Treponema sp.]|nr:CotH kinase family protein [Treponema sp.]